MRITCKCGRYIGTAHGTVVASFKCPRCPETVQVKHVADYSHDLRFKFSEVPSDKIRKEEALKVQEGSKERGTGESS